MPLARLVPLLAAGLLSLGGSPARGCESYFVLVWAYQNKPNLPRDTHSFATFVKVTRPPGEPAQIEHHTLSWLPVSMEVRALRPRPEPGHNLTLGETLDVAREQGLQLSLFGPYEIKESLYERSVRQMEKLHSGRIRYKALDAGYPTTRVSNCVHAVSDLVYWPPRLRVSTPAWGESASYRIVLHLRRYLIDPKVTHDWLIDALGLGDCPVLRRHYGQFWLWFPR